MAEVQAGVKCNYDITSPEIAGFIADQTEVSFKDVYSEDQTVTVTYKGGEANYQVKHYLLNPDGSQPTVPVDTETLAGEVGLNTQAVAKEYEGFTPKPIAQVAIGTDGMTVVEVLYERNLYTLTWDTGEGGSYIAPTEVVYGATVDKPVAEPCKKQQKKNKDYTKKQVNTTGDVYWLSRFIRSFFFSFLAPFFPFLTEFFRK